MATHLERAMQEVEERLEAELVSCKTGMQQLQRHFNMQLAAAEKQTENVSYAAGEAAQKMKEEHGKIVSQMLRDHQNAQDAVQRQLMLAEVRMSKLTTSPC